MFPAIGLVGCNQEAKHDAEMLDAQLASIHIDHVDFVSWDRQTTNTISGAEAQKILASLNAENRIHGWESKDGLRRVNFMNGKQLVLELSLTASGLWRYGACKFCVRETGK